MKILIIGPGALGCLLASHLIRAKQEVILLDHDKERAGRLKKQGINEEGLCGSHSFKVPVTADPAEAAGRELAIMCVKSYDTESALKSVKPVLNKDTYLMSLQNGLGNLQLLGEYADVDRIVGGVTEDGATLTAEGEIKHAGRGETYIGLLNGTMRGNLRDIADIFNKAGFSTRMSRDINAVVWSKLVVNVGINALAAITGLKNGMLTEYEGSRDIMKRAVTEAVKVAKRKKIKLLYDDPIQKVEAVCKNTAGNTSSMLQDVLKRKMTEIDYINGAVVRQAKSLNIPTPANEMLTQLINTIQESYKAALGKGSG